MFLRSLECYLDVYFPRCWELGKYTLSCIHKQFATLVHALFYIMYIYMILE